MNGKEARKIIEALRFQFPTRRMEPEQGVRARSVCVERLGDVVQELPAEELRILLMVAEALLYRDICDEQMRLQQMQGEEVEVLMRKYGIDMTSAVCLLAGGLGDVLQDIWARQGVARV